MKSLHALLPLGLAAALAACSSVAEVTGTATQDDLTQLRADVTALQLNYQRAKTDGDRQAQQTEARLAQQERDSQKTAEDLGQRVDALGTTLAGLTSRVDELSKKVDALSRRLASAPPQSAKPSTPSAPHGQPRPTPSPAASAPTTGPLQPQDLYQAAYLDFSKGNYQLAIAGFREFLRRFPDNEQAGSAQYWIGEALYSESRSNASAGQAQKASQELEQSVQEFRKVLANYPRSDKAPTALYKEALALFDLKQPDLARSRLQYLIDNFPQAEEAGLARDRLAALKGEQDGK